MAITLIANLNGVLKTLYPEHKVEYMVLKDHPALGMIPKNTSFGGDSVKVPLVYSNGQGRSCTIATAIAGATVPTNTAFFVTRCMDYGVYQISGEAAMAAEKNEDAFVRSIQMEVDAKFRETARSISNKLFGDGSGSLGRVTALPGGNFFNMSVEDAAKIEVGNVLRASTGPGDQFAATRVGGTMIVTTINRATGLIGCAAGLIAALGIGDDLSIDGDRGTAAINAHALKLSMTGFSGYLGAASATLGLGVAMFGVTRNVDSRLYGTTDATAYATVEEGLIEIAGQVASQGGSPDTCFINPKQFRILQKEIGGNTQYQKIPAKSFAGGDSALISYRGLVLDGPAGPITVTPDMSCQAGVGYMLQRDTWELRSIGPAPRLLNFDGQDFVRLAGADAYEGRVGFYGNLVCYAPGFNGQVTGLPLV